MAKKTTVKRLKREFVQAYDEKDPDKLTAGEEIVERFFKRAKTFGVLKELPPPQVYKDVVYLCHPLLEKVKNISSQDRKRFHAMRTYFYEHLMKHHDWYCVYRNLLGLSTGLTCYVRKTSFIKTIETERIEQWMRTDRIFKRWLDDRHPWKLFIRKPRAKPIRMLNSDQVYDELTKMHLVVDGLKKKGLNTDVTRVILRLVFRPREKFTYYFDYMD